MSKTWDDCRKSTANMMIRYSEILDYHNVDAQNGEEGGNGA